MDTILRFSACDRKNCVKVFIVNDIILENDESFDLTLERTTGLDSRITLNPVNGVVEITDNDGRYDDYMVVYTYCQLYGQLSTYTNSLTVYPHYPYTLKHYMRGK